MSLKVLMEMEYDQMTPRNRYSDRFPVTKEYEETRTQQHFAEELDINSIVKKYGIVKPPPMIAAGSFMDCGSGTTFHDHMNQVTKARSLFEQLPSDLRSRFDNDVAALLDFVTDEENKEEAVKLGLLPDESVPTEPSSGESGDPVPPAEPVAPAPATPEPEA